MNYIYANLGNQSSTKITIFSIPKPFYGHIGVIQHNAIVSWTLLTPKPEIILFGDEQGTREICQKFNLIHIPEIQRNKYATPLLDGIFAEIHHRASNDIIAYLNADIILTNDFSLGIQSVSQELDDYLLIGRRWNVEIDRELKFNPGWKSSLDRLIRDKGCLANYDCKDYFVFPRHLFADIPSFALGRGYWDTWMVRKALADGYPVVDGSLVITAIHQNHPYTHIRGGRNEAYMGREAQINKTLGGVNQPGNIACATWQLKPEEYKNLPTVSIIITTQNQRATIEKAVLSALIQDYQDYEIIVVDRGSDDETKAVLQTYESKINYCYLEREGIVDAYSYGLKVARGEFVTFLDASSILLPGVLGKQVAYFEKEASTLDIMLSGCRVVEGEEVIEYKPWEDLPDLENLNFNQLDLVKSFLNQSCVIFRLNRLKFIKDLNYNLSRRCTLTEIIICDLVFLRGCRINWLKFIAQSVYS